MEQAQEHRHHLTRREFVAGIGAGLLLTACGRSPDIAILPEVQPIPEQLANSGINSPATAYAQAERLTPPTTAPPNIWTPGQFITHVAVNGNLMALTFDDGPSPYNTEPILRDLEKHKVFATFFVIGAMARAFPHVLEQLRDAGHEIGNHSVHHSPYQASPLAAQVAENQQIIREISGITPGQTVLPG